MVHDYWLQLLYLQLQESTIAAIKKTRLDKQAAEDATLYQNLYPETPEQEKCCLRRLHGKYEELMSCPKCGRRNSYTKIGG